MVRWSGEVQVNVSGMSSLNLSLTLVDVKLVLSNLQKSTGFILAIRFHIGYAVFKGLSEKTAFYQHNIVGVSKWEGSEKILHCNVALIKSGLDAAGIDDGKSGSVVSARSIGPDHRIGDKVSWKGTLSKKLR